MWVLDVDVVIGNIAHNFKRKVIFEKHSEFKYYYITLTIYTSITEFG